MSRPAIQRLAAWALGLIALGAAGPQAAAAQLQAYAGATGGIASGPGPFGCATGGPTIGAGWFAGVVLPLEGFGPCGLGGGIDNKIAATGPLSSHQTVNAAVTGGSFVGEASAWAQYGLLGVAAKGTMTGGSTSSTYAQAAGFARFQETLTLNKPGVVTGTAGTVDFAFLIDGLMQSLPKAPYTQQGDIALGIRVGDGVGNAARAPWYSFMGTIVSGGEPNVRGGGTGMPGAFVLTPGNMAGSAEVLSTANFQIQWGVPFEMEVALLTSVYPCCYGTSLESDFLTSALLTGISARAGGVAVTDFTVLSASGTGYGPGGLLPVPEPATVVLWGCGLLLALSHRHRPRS